MIHERAGVVFGNVPTARIVLYYWPVINPTVLQQAARYREQFDRSQPFRHLVMDYFFDVEPAKRLLAEFPSFHPDNARNEFGEVGRKAVVTQIATISPFYAEVYGFVSSREFLDFISHVTGIPELVHDEKMFGGGTHENLEGQELDPHVDFNFIEDRKLHRRLNLLLYLNTEWEQSWGGCLELHSNPRRPREDQIMVIEPLFNRCVIFETSEHSWHGFEKIRLPEGKKNFSRKLLSIYLYTRSRPAEEIAPPHGTFYVQRPLPGRIAPGQTLEETDARQIEELLTRRDHWIEFYQKKELADSARIQQYITHIRQNERTIEILNSRVAELESYLRYFRWAKVFLPKKSTKQPQADPRARLDASPPLSPATKQEAANSAPWTGTAPPAQRIPLAGYASQEGSAQGFWPDGWIGSPFEVSIRLRQPIEGVRIIGYLPNSHPQLELQVVVNDRIAGRDIVFPGAFSLFAKCKVAAGELMNVKIAADKTYSPARASASSDARDLAVALWEVLLLHTSPSAP